MRIRYLPEIDRQALRKLRNAESVDSVAEILNEVIHREYSLQALWEYRKFFDLLTPKQFEKYPDLYIGYSHIFVLRGKLSEAKRYLKMAPQDSILTHYAWILMPANDKEQWRESMAQIRKDNRGKGGEFTITAGRPSVINGAWDMTQYLKFAKDNKDTVIRGFEKIYGEQAESIYTLALAEHLYYQDKCYDALVLIVSLIPKLKEERDMRLLFVALVLECFIMVTKNQTSSTVSLIENLREQISYAGHEEFLPNIDAFDAWCAMYDGDYARVVKWMREDAPDEFSRFCMLDTFRYMVKMRAYIILGKYLSVTALCKKLLPILEEGKRYMDICELHLIWAMSDHADGREVQAISHLKEALALSEKYHYDRLIADEGKRVLDLLRLYRNDETKSPYLSWITELTEATATQFPRYLKTQLPEKPSLTPKEMMVLRLLCENMSNTEIASELEISIDTVKTHIKKIFAKLEVKNRRLAAQRAEEYGLIKA